MKKFLIPFAALLIGSVSAAHAQATAFKSGERTREDGLKDCYYSALGQDYVYTVGGGGICPLSMPVSVQLPLPTPAGAVGFKTGEVTRGNVKDCYYSALGQTYVSTISTFALCPLSITVP